MTTMNTQHATTDYDVIVIGAGVSGLYSLYKLRELGFSARVFEAGSGVGGTWYWNRYPGARFDSESYSYQYSFSEALINEWSWSEHFAAQPEIEQYMNFVADKFDLKRDIEFNSRIQSVVYDDEQKIWCAQTESGKKTRARFVVAAVGFLSAHQFPEYPGVEDFAGLSVHTARWPRDGLDFSKSRVGIIGTGPTAVQVIQSIAPEVKHLTVFQRTANWCTPLRNRPIDEPTQREVKRDADKIFATCKETFAAFMHVMVPGSAYDVSREERLALYEELYQRGGFALWLANYKEVFTTQEIADEVAEFLASKIRQRVHDPVTAEKLIPKNHTFGTKRPPGEKNFYEAFNQHNVDLVDLRASPIKRITPSGIETSETHIELDAIIYATGFRSLTGELLRIDIRGRNGLSLQDKWAHGPKTNLGIQFAGFPNFFAVIGPHNPASFCNIPRCIESNVEWITDCINFLRSNQYHSIETSLEAEQAWTEECLHSAEGLLLNEMTDSWFHGNTNQGGERGQFLLYAGGAPKYRQLFAEIAAAGYRGFELS